MSVHCLFCKSRSWEECSTCSYSKKLDDNHLLLAPSGLVIDREGNVELYEEWKRGSEMDGVSDMEEVC